MLCSILLLHNDVIFSQAYTEKQAYADWAVLNSKPLTEENFRAACDLMQKIGKTNLEVSYKILAEYVPLVKATGNRQWVHILLMGWAKVKGSFGFLKTRKNSTSRHGTTQYLTIAGTMNHWWVRH